MALHRTSVSRRGSKNDSHKEDDDVENNGYIQILVKPLEQGNYSFILNWLGLNEPNHFTNQHAGIVYGILLLFGSVIVYQLLRCDVGFIFQKICGLIVPLFTIVCSFYWLSLYLRKTWSTTSVYLLFSSCFVGESLAQLFLVSSWGPYEVAENFSITNTTQPLVIFVVLLAVCSASVFSSLETTHSALVISLVSFGRYLACANLVDLPQSLRPYLAYSCGLAGFVVAKYMETVLKPQISNFMTSDGKIPVIKRRRSSSSNASAFSAHRSTRRTSLPALIQKLPSSSPGFESAVISEAHGIISDMLADNSQSLPRNVISGLKAVSSLLAPPENHSSIHKTRVSPLVSVIESTIYGSDSEENPYLGERPSSLPKRLRRSLPPSLIRRMSTSTWTTTTSATGMPTLEPEPNRSRSASFRHSRDVTPGSSPTGSRSNSPSPISQTVVLTIPKSRSFSMAATTQPISSNNHVKRLLRKSMTPLSSSETAVSQCVSKPQKIVSPLFKSGMDTNSDKEDRTKMPSSTKEHFSSHIRKLNVTSDYESNDSPSSSDYSDNVPTSDELLSVSPPKRVPLTHPSHIEDSCTQNSQIGVRSLHSRILDDDERKEVAVDSEDDEDSNEIVNIRQNAERSGLTQIVDNSRTDLLSEKTVEFIDKKETSFMNNIFDVSELDKCELLNIHRLSEWDYPVFELADICGNFILSKVAYKLFMEVGLFETFRIPVDPFISYFHALEMGYRDKPYHNRVHATDVLHGVYYLTTQPVPGFTQISTGDIFSRQVSSSESDGDAVERTNFPHHCGNVPLTDDSYGIMGCNFPALELMALYTAAAMHDYDHPGRTNAFLVATHAPQAILYNDRSVLENHHAAAAWNLLLCKPEHNFLSGLDQAEFKRFRYLVIEAILATDLKRHFEILAEFNAKANDDDAPGIDWTNETDRMLVSQMVIKLADINGPAKERELHTSWTMRIAEEFYEQGDEEANRGMQISPYMDRRNPQLAKLQETFINHLVAPLCNCMVSASLLPGIWVEEESDNEANSDSEKGDSTSKDTEDETDTEAETVEDVPDAFDEFL